MNKKILFYYSKLNIGGAEKSLIRFMNALVRDGNEVTLLTKYAHGDAEYLLNSKVIVKSLSSDNTFASKTGIVKKVLQALAIFQRCLNLIRWSFNHEEYDLLLVGSFGVDPSMISRFIKYKKCVMCIRNDISKCQGNAENIKLIKKCQKIVDYYLCVSGTVKTSLDNAIPDLRSKSFVLYNFLNLEEMKCLLKEAVNPFPKDGRFHIVTVCRVSDKAKGIFRMIDICEQLKQEKYSFSWYLVGDGPDLLQTEIEIEKRNLKDCFITVGKVDNPFGYLKYSDFVAVLSYYEGLCGVVNEAKVAGNAVLATEFSGIYEQIQNGINGIIVNNEKNSILETMRRLLDSPKMIERMKNEIYPKEILDDDEKIKKLYAVLNWGQTDEKESD